MTAPTRGQPDERQPRSVVLLWNPQRGGWSRERHTEFAQHIIEFGSQVDNWSTGARKSGIARGDGAYLLRVGSAPRGVIGSGRFLGEVFQAPHWSAARSDPANIIEIDWEVLLSPDQVLPREELLGSLPGWPRYIQGSGYLLPPPVANGLRELWNCHPPTRDFRRRAAASGW